MKVLILGAGYGTRLERDIKADQSGKYASLVGIPKPLIPINHRELISYWYDLLLHTRSDGTHAFHPDDIYIVANQHNHALYKEWATRHKIPTSNIINDGSTTNETRLGAIRDIVLAMDVAKIDEDLMVIGGDTLFFDDFDLGHVIQTFNAHDNNLVLWYPTEDTLRTGILVTDDNSIVTDFLEKPKPEATPSRKACPCFYIYKKQTLPIIKAYVAAARSLADVDAPGSLITHLHSRSSVYAYPISGRFDIGGLDTYIEADDFFRQRAEIMHDKERQQQRWYAALVIGAITVPLLLGGIYYFAYSSSSSRSKPSRR